MPKGRRLRLVGGSFVCYLYACAIAAISAVGMKLVYKGAFGKSALRPRVGGRMGVIQFLTDQ